MHGVYFMFYSIGDYYSPVHKELTALCPTTKRL